MIVVLGDRWFRGCQLVRIPIWVQPNSLLVTPHSQMSCAFYTFEEGRSCIALDITYGGPGMDIMSPEGYAHAIYQVLSIKTGGSLTLAPVCSSWVWVILGNVCDQSFSK